MVVVGGGPNLMLAEVQVFGSFGPDLGPDLGPGPELDNLGHISSIDQSDASIQVTCLVLTNKSQVSRVCDQY